jgi:hypothetical protein
MPGTTYPSSAYPGQVQSVYRSQSTGYVYPNIRPSVTPGTGVTNTARPVQNTVLNNTPRRRLTPYESNTTNSAYYERNTHPSFDHPRQSQANNSPSPSPPHLQQMPYHQYHNFNGRGGDMFSYFAVPPQSHASWDSSVPATHPLSGANTASMNFTPPPPPPASAPEVWILDCKNCGTFLSNRGMKVRTTSLRCYLFIIYLLLCLLSLSLLIISPLPRINTGGTPPQSKRLPFLNRCPPYQLFSLLCQPGCPWPHPAPFFLSEPATRTDMRMSDSNIMLSWMWMHGRLHDRLSCQSFSSSF